MKTKNEEMPPNIQLSESIRIALFSERSFLFCLALLRCNSEAASVTGVSRCCYLSHGLLDSNWDLERLLLIKTCYLPLMDEMPKIWVPSSSEYTCNGHHQSCFFANIFLNPLNISEGLISIYHHFGFVFYKQHVHFSFALKQEKKNIIRKKSNGESSAMWEFFCLVAFGNF